MKILVSSADGSTPLVDMVQYGRMREALGDSFPGIISKFFDETDEFTSRLSALAESADPKCGQDLCHEIKGVSSTIGFSAISTYAANCEEQFKKGLMEHAGNLPATFSALFEETKAQAILLAETDEPSGK